MAWYAELGCIIRNTGCNVRQSSNQRDMRISFVTARRLARDDPSAARVQCSNEMPATAPKKRLNINICQNCTHGDTALDVLRKCNRVYQDPPDTNANVLADSINGRDCHE